MINLFQYSWVHILGAITIFILLFMSVSYGINGANKASYPRVFSGVIFLGAAAVLKSIFFGG